jgi:hypothetical protein
MRACTITCEAPLGRENHKAKPAIVALARSGLGIQVGRDDHCITPPRR